MLFFLALFLVFLYFKVARIHKKEEKGTPLVYLQHFLVGFSAIGIFLYGFTHFSWYIVLISSLVFFIIAALIITAIQLGIFIDGKPQFGISKFYKLLPVLTLSVMILSAILSL